MNARQTQSPARLPLSYFISRSERLTRVRAGDRDEVRLIRTELELLRRIHRHTRRQRESRGDRFAPPNASKYAPAARRELIEIMADSADPIVEKMIAVLDSEFSDTRKEIMMSVVNDEAEKIAHEAAESGAHELAEPAGDRPDPSPIPTDVDESLRLAEAQLAASEQKADQPAKLSVAPDQTVPRADPISREGDQPKTEDRASQPPTEAVAVKPGDIPESEDGSTDQRPAAKASEPTTQAGPPEPASAPEPDDKEPKANPGDVAYTPERAEQAVAAIEGGIRKLAHLLRTEVKDQWDQAKTAMDSVGGAKDQIDGVCQLVRETLEQVKHATKEIHAERDEARLFRQEAQRAKERAETSAAAAELAADQATDELRSIHESRSRDSEAPGGVCDPPA